jgi:hypothetical protein
MRPDTGRTHEWWDPSVKYPNLLLRGPDGAPLESCRQCGVMKGANADRRNCPGVVHVELRAKEATDAH